MTPTPKRKILTDRTIDARKTPGIIRDTKISQLQLRVRDGGAKSWSLRYRHRGKQKRITLGSYPALKLAEARDRARDAIRDIEDGTDPQIEKQERRAADTFGELADIYIAQHAMKKKRSWKVDRWMLDRHVLPTWKDRLASDITRRDVRELIEKIADPKVAEPTSKKTPAPILANRVVALLSKVFKFALDREIVTTSPAVGIARPGTEQKRDRVLTDGEIRKFWTATESLDASMRAYWRTRLLTAQRGIEVNTMRWADVDLDSGWWTIPATVAKNKLSHRVPLSPTALELIKALSSDTAYVFDGARGKRQQREAAATFDIADFRGHDLRRTAATKMASSGIQRLVIGKVLNHVEPGVTSVYDRHTYDAEKRIALDTWARTLDAILKNKPADVIPFVAPNDAPVFTPDANPKNADWIKSGAPDVDANGTVVRR
jgi:integrase